MTIIHTQTRNSSSIGMMRIKKSSKLNRLTTIKKIIIVMELKRMDGCRKCWWRKKSKRRPINKISREIIINDMVKITIFSLSKIL